MNDASIKYVYPFGKSGTEGNKEMKNLLGGKGANLAEMANLGLPVPPGFTITTEACLNYIKTSSIPDQAKKQTLAAISKIEKELGKKFGDEKNPLLFSVRSGARVSMPGMMDTVLNLGLNEKSTKGLALQTGNERFAWDSYRRFIQMYADVVMGFNSSILESTLEDLKDARNVKDDTELSAADLKNLVAVYKKIIVEESGEYFPEKPEDQLWKAIGAVFNSWNNSRAIKYRDLNNIAHNWGTAVNVQSMVFGNMGNDCATGVCFTRNPSTGENKFFGEFLINAQGEDVVAGIRTPSPINHDSKNESNKTLPTLSELLPTAFDELVSIYNKLEKHYRDMQDIEFTIEKNQLFILQTRSGKRTVAAAVRIAVEMVNEGMISKEEAVLRIPPNDIDQLLHPKLDPNYKKTVLATGLPASPGAASGRIALTSEMAAKMKDNQKTALLVRHETSPEDISGMAVSQGILTARGGMTSHAAVVARGMGKPCVAGCTLLQIDLAERTVLINGKHFNEGDPITIDGATGEIMDGIVPTVKATIGEHFKIFMNWADEFRVLKVRANADNPADGETAVNFGAEGIGLCRTEHMFFGDERVLAIRQMLFARNDEEIKRALDKLLPFQEEDFTGIFRALNGKPVNIRLLDLPLHEFLPQTEKEKKHLAESLDITLKEIENVGKQLEEFNPMLGHRGCRMGITSNLVYITQVKAIAKAAVTCSKEGIVVIPEIMIPLIATEKELAILRELTKKIVDQIFAEKNVKIKYKIGTMIELPRAAITADEIAKSAEFFSFGTNDLTQTTFGLSRDDAGKFLPEYRNLGIIKSDPFASLDQQGVGFLVSYAIKKGREANPNLHFGVCGEHGGDPDSITFFHNNGLDYISCSPYRIPVARLAAAQAAIKFKR